MVEEIDADEDPNCPICREDVREDQDGPYCDLCSTWFHRNCLFFSEEDYIQLSNSKEPWYCSRCTLIKNNKIKWGQHEGEEAMQDLINSAYNNILDYKKNIFFLPRGKSGTEFLKIVSNLLKLFVNKTKWERLAIPLVHIFVPLMLQKPSAKSKPKDNAKYLISRLERWQNGELKSILDETNEIQKRMKKAATRKEEAKEKTFIRLMMFGKIGDAAKCINNDDSVKGVHQLNDEIKKILLDKHPKSREVNAEILLPITEPTPQPVMFEQITAETVQKTARYMKGSGGPTLVDSEIWRDFLCSKAFGKASLDLCQSIAEVAKILCTKDVHPSCLVEFLACRLIPLDKGETKDGKPGVRPIGIGEVLRRLIGKLLIGVIKDDIIEAAGPLQTCSGVKSGIEAAVHAMRKVYERPETEAILLVDAENAFNNLNRKAALHNIRELCPPFHQYLSNTYRKPAKLIIVNEKGHDYILSEEGSTQGDVAAMAKYALGIKPLIGSLHEAVDIKKCLQAWYADDSSSAGELVEMKKWWDNLCEQGPKYGYFPLATKTILIVKEDSLEKAREIFGGSGVKISTQGERHMGAVVGSNAYKEEYVSNKIKKWVNDIEELTLIAKDEPQSALCSFTKAIAHRWTYLQRTVPNISHLFAPLEEVIREKFIPALVGRKISDTERNIFALPVRFGGIGIPDPTTTSDTEYNISATITTPLANIIVAQETDYVNYNQQQVNETIKRMKVFKENNIRMEMEEIMNKVDEKTKRSLTLAQEKGAGSWLSVPPIKSLGYTLNKQEFRDSICLRYDWKIPNTPNHCHCGQKNDVNHALSCKKGGYVMLRHNRIRDMEAEIMKDVCTDVKIEPELLPLNNQQLNGNNAEKARLDVSGIGVWAPLERTFIDVRIMHPNCPTYINKDIRSVYTQHEREKKRAYNERILNVEKGSFTPIVMTTTGGMGNEAEKFHKRMATLISEKRNENYSDVLNHLRTKLRFCLLKSTLIAIRGIRGRQKREDTTPMSSLSYNLINFDD